MTESMPDPSTESVALPRVPASPTPYYQDDFATIYHGDCREVLASLAADVVVTDPPYGVGLLARSSKRGVRPGRYASYEDTPGNVSSVVIPTVETLIDLFGRVVITPGLRAMWLYPKPTDVGVIWSAAGAGMTSWGFNCSQPILYYGKDPYLARGLGSRPNGMAWNNATEENGHPCPKPLPVMKWLVARACFPGETVLDPFMGSGTTLRAAKDLGRHSIGIEIEEAYCEIAAKRLAQEVLDFGGVA